MSILIIQARIQAKSCFQTDIPQLETSLLFQGRTTDNSAINTKEAGTLDDRDHIGELRTLYYDACGQLSIEREAKRAAEDALRKAKLAHRPLEDALLENRELVLKLEDQVRTLRARVV